MRAALAALALLALCDVASAQCIGIGGRGFGFSMCAPPLGPRYGDYGSFPYAGGRYPFPPPPAYGVLRPLPDGGRYLDGSVGGSRYIPRAYPRYRPGTYGEQYVPPMPPGAPPPVARLAPPPRMVAPLAPPVGPVGPDPESDASVPEAMPPAAELPPPPNLPPGVPDRSFVEFCSANPMAPPCVGRTRGQR